MKITFSKVLIILYLVVSSVTLYIFATWYRYEKPLIDESVARKQFLEEGKILKISDTLKIKKLIINLPSRTRKLRFLDLSAHLVPFNENDLKLLESQEYIVKDTIIELAGKMKPERLNSVSGKLILEEKIVKAINTIYKRDVVKEIYFSRFLIQ